MFSKSAAPVAKWNSLASILSGSAAPLFLTENIAISPPLVPILKLLSTPSLTSSLALGVNVPLVPPIPTSLPLTVIGAFVKLFESPEPDHKATLWPVPCPSNTEELSTFCHPFAPAPSTTYIAQSPTFQSVMPLKLVAPFTETIQNWPLLAVNADKSGVSVSAFQVPSKLKPAGISPIKFLT